MSRAEDALTRTAQHQDGLFTRAQARDAGVTGRVLDRRVAAGLLVEHQPRVYGATVAPYRLAQRERAALLAAGDRAMISHDNAAARWELDVPTPATVWLTMPFGCRPPALEGVEIMRSRHLEGMRWLLDGVPLTSPARTWVDLGRTCTAEQLEAALARGLQRNQLTLEKVQRVLEVAHNRAGTRLVREVLPRFEPAWESVLSARFARLVSAAGLRLEAGVEVRRPGGGRLALLDFADVERRMAFEVDGWWYHGSKAQQQRDRVRDRALLAIGWVTVRFTTEDILRRPADVVDEVRGLLASRAA